MRPSAQHTSLVDINSPQYSVDGRQPLRELMQLINAKRGVY
jgi:hypothetical protein